MAQPRRRWRRRIGAAIAIFLAFAIGIGVTWGADSLLWGALAGLGAGALSWGLGFFWPGGEAALAEADDGLSDDLGLGDS